MSKITISLTIFLLFFSLNSCAEKKIYSQDSYFEFNDFVVEDFVKGSEDIPLLKNMEIIENKIVSFDSEISSYISVAYKSEIEIDAVRDFYLKTLPEMGWNVEINNSKEVAFIRENDRVKIEFEHLVIDESQNSQAEDVVIFSISSNNKN